MTGAAADDVIGAAVHIVGHLFSKQDLFVDCILRGSIEASECKLTIGPNARIEGQVRALELVVFGTISGNVAVKNRVEVHAGARFAGELITSRIVIEDGADFCGSIDMAGPRNLQQQPAPRPIDAEARYAELVESKYSRGLNTPEQIELDALAAGLAEEDAPFYEPLLQTFEDEFVSKGEGSR
jgi:cytoskeletal protein CcmA (bactofilin family)